MEFTVNENDKEQSNSNTEDGKVNLIKPINRDTVHRICSGQVVLSLAIAMKELAENSIDAGATRIDIRLVEYGSELLEVADNGSGVLKDNFEALTLKHFTSKIQKFSDLETIGTLGFRGEALSSLCALSDLVIITKHSTADFATKISYDRNGKIIEQAITAREQGTTVILKKLFSTLPVRRKEFMKNLKRDYNKMCQLLYAYCLVSKRIKFSCTNLTNKGSKSTVVATDGHETVRENVINIFGAKQISTLIDVELTIPDEPILTEYGMKLATGEEIPFTFEFLISSVVHGSGRSTTDRQFYYINSRPCEPSKIIKLVNEIYKQFNFGQYPFVFLNVMTKSSLVDVNVTPDKRQVFIENEKILLATLKSSLLEAFKTFPSTYKMQNMDISQMLATGVKIERGVKRCITESSIKKGSILQKFKKRSKTEGNSPLASFELITEKEETGFDNKLVDSDIEEEADQKLEILVDIACKLSTENKSEKIVENVTDTEDIEICLDEPTKKISSTKSVTLKLSVDDIKISLNKNSTDNEQKVKVRFRTKLIPENNKDAEEELEKQISKSDFGKMEILGQFNLGFIVVKLNNDLFIVDQHATDEKYNFEQLQMNTVIDSQVLVNPKPLELTAGNETLLMENCEVFKKNGFVFKIDDKAPSTKKVALAAIPISKNCVFGKDDIDEMLFMLQDSSHTMCRPSRIRAMFASRACRKSVMIGKHLSKTDMRRLIDHMGEIDQPWNCPHGRPTMRHLINLDLLQECV
ncbi:hypothetical protein NQ317_019345 [Molorchus minor]|uniref:Mismatch repair endonuclease PMS2 n=1 Tax=Molorchus minor TaxID=1323400 RepID=A0ABQ9JAI4_9CUCU|nr:hypothetical protein NQ317_019345 [Molorchus minor]